MNTLTIITILRGPSFMQSLDIQGFSYEERHGLLPTLTSAFADCGGWILDRKTLSPSTMEFRLEIQLRAVVDLYTSIIASGLELTRVGHLGLTHLCTCRKHLSTAVELGQVVSIRIEISFLEDATLQSVFTKPPAWTRFVRASRTQPQKCHSTRSGAL